MTDREILEWLLRVARCEEHLHSGGCYGDEIVRDMEWILEWTLSDKCDPAKKPPVQWTQPSMRTP